MTIAVQGVLEFSIQGPCPSYEDYHLSLPDRRIFAVSDGIGAITSGRGRAAAMAACDAIKQFLVKEAGDEEATLPFVLRTYFSLAGNVLFNALYHANRSVRKLNSGKKLPDQVGVSVLAGYLDGDLLALANVGSCSAWLLRGGHASELVKPRTLGALLDPLALLPGSDLPVETRNLPLICLGPTDDLEPEIFELKLLPGDWILLGTDGINSKILPQLLAIQAHGDLPEVSINDLREALKYFRVEDNATGILIFV